MREEAKPVHTLCHGDFWSNNILFTYGDDPDNPSSLIIIDYQLIFVGSPCYGKFLTAILHRGLRNDFFFHILFGLSGPTTFNLNTYGDIPQFTYNY